MPKTFVIVVCTSPQVPHSALPTPSSSVLEAHSPCLTARTPRKLIGSKTPFPPIRTRTILQQRPTLHTAVLMGIHAADTD